MKIQDYDISKLDVNLQDTIDDVKNILNNSNYEVRVTTASSPGWTEKTNGIMVLSIYGGSTRLYISNTTAPNGWVYVDLTDL